MGEKLAEIRPTFNGSIVVEGRPERLTSESGAIVLREGHERLGLIDELCNSLHDPRDQRFVTHSLEELLRARILSSALGWTDQSDVKDLREDAVMRMAVSDRKGLSPMALRSEEERQRCHNPKDPDGMASQPTQSRLLGHLSDPQNIAVLRNGLVESASGRIRSLNKGHQLQHMTLDIDSLPIDVHGSQVGAAFNGYYGRKVFHPLIASSAETGDLLDVELREGNCHTAEGSQEFILRLIDQVEAKICMVASIRMDAGFPEDDLLCAIEEREVGYVARVKNNAVLDRMAEPYAVHPRDREVEEGRLHFHEMQYQAGSWSKPRRVVLVIVEQEGMLTPRHFWLITNWDQQQMPAQDLLDHYRKRGKAEAHFGEWMDVLSPHLSSAARPKTHYRGTILDPATRFPMDSFSRNHAALLISALAYNLLHLVRALLGRATRQGWSIRRVQQKVLRAAGRVVLHGRRAVTIVSDSIMTIWALLWKQLNKVEIIE